MAISTLLPEYLPSHQLCENVKVLGEREENFK